MFKKETYKNQNFGLSSLSRRRLSSFRQRKIAYALISSATFAFLTFLLYPCFLPSSSFAEQSPTATPSITISGTGSIIVNSEPGTFASGSQSVSVSTTNYTGYNLTMSPASGNNTDLVNEASATIPTITLPSGEDSITSSGFDSTSYGFSTDGTNYKPVTTNTAVEYKTVASNDTINLTFGVMTTAETPSGTYEKTFMLTALANSPTYTVTFNANAGGDTVSNMPTSADVILSGAVLEMPYQVPTRTGYAFAGWALSDSSSTVAAIPSGTYELDAESANVLTFYAIWAVPMQGWTGCDSMSIGDSTFVYDTRDNQVYRVAKLKMDSEGTTSKCWMMENLGLGKYNLTTDLDSTNTNIAWTITSSTFNGWRTTSDDTPTYSDGQFFNRSVTQDSYGNKYGTTYNYYAASGGYIDQDDYSTNVFTTTYNLCPSGWRLPTAYFTGNEYQQLMDAYGITSSPAGATTLQEDFGFSLTGLLYNGGIANTDTGYYWGARVVNDGGDQFTFTSSTVSGALVNRQYGGAIRCIVSDGKVPINFYKNSNTATGTMAQFLAEKNTYNTLPTNAFSNSGYTFYRWNQRTDGLGSAFTDGSSLSVSGNGAINFYAMWTAPMQNWSGCSGLSAGEVVWLKDTRDNRLYSVSKLNTASDGSTTQCWMTQNLNLGASDISVELNSTNTNITWSIPAATFNSWRVGSGTTSDATVGQFAYRSGSDANGSPYGTYYNYYAASAGYVEGGSLSQDKFATSSNICPAGWRLPTGGYTNSEYGKLLTAYSVDSSAAGSTVLQETLHFPLNGILYNGALANTSQGYYWSAYAAGNGAYTLNFTSSTVSQTSNIIRAVGAAVRCVVSSGKITVSFDKNNTSATGSMNSFVAESGTYNTLPTNTFTKSGYTFKAWNTNSTGSGSTISNGASITLNGTGTLTLYAQWTANLQNWNDCANLEFGDILWLKDTRDNQYYRVQKLKLASSGLFNQCQIVDNLNLGAIDLSEDLTSSNTNTNTTISATTFNGWLVSSNTTGSMTTGQYVFRSGKDSYGNPYGGIYNYYAATLGSIADQTVSDETYATRDICPAGWRLPYATNEITMMVRDGYGIATTDLTSLQTVLHYAAAGLLYNGTIANGTQGYYLTAHPSGSTDLHGFNVTTSGWQTATWLRTYGGSVRCVINNTDYIIQFDKNASDATGTMSDANLTVSSSAQAIPTNTYQRSGYYFAGWRLGKNSNGGVIDGMSNIIFSAPSAHTWYAEWVPIAGTLQTWNSCSSLSEGQVIALQDNRDGQYYRVTKIKGPNNTTRCWMMDNLRLGRTTLTTDLTSSNTNLTTTITAATFNSWKNNTANLESFAEGRFTDRATKGDLNMSDYATIYNFFAASAGTVSTQTVSGVGNTESDICPAGWRLIQEEAGQDDNGEFRQLLTANGITDTAEGAEKATSELSLPFSGLANTASEFGGAAQTGTKGVYWSAMYGDNVARAHLITEDYSIASHYSTTALLTRTQGAAIRCIKK